MWADGPVEEVVDRIRQRVGPNEPLFFTYGEELENFARGVLARFNRIFYTLIGLTGLLGGLAVANLMVSSVLERHRELLLLRASGASARQLGRVVVCDGLVLSTLGIGFGVPLGIALAAPMADILTEAFGWTVTFVVPWLRISALAACGLAGTLLMGIYPARLARRPVGRVTLAFE